MDRKQDAEIPRDFPVTITRALLSFPTTTFLLESSDCFLMLPLRDWANMYVYCSIATSCRNRGADEETTCSLTIESVLIADVRVDEP
jgi:hypothetical protein